MSAFRLRRLLKPDILKAIEPRRLCRFLGRFDGALSEFEFAIPPEHEADGLDYDSLITLLQNPTSARLHDLCEALYFIDEMSAPAPAQKLLKEFKQRFPEFILSDNCTEADVAIAAWEHSPALLQQLHAERAIVRRRKFRLFSLAEGASLDRQEITDRSLADLQARLSREFSDRKRGTVTRLFVSQDGCTEWYMIRYGAMHIRAGCVESGRSSSVIYQPEEYDVVGFNSARGELRINSGLSDPIEVYLPVFGSLLFGDERCFGNEVVYSLEPLRVLGEASLLCEPDLGIARIKLTEVHVTTGIFNHRQIDRADDVFALLKFRRRRLPQSNPIAEARFQVEFTATKSRRSVQIRVPDQSQYARDEDSSAIEEWLTRRGFKRRLSDSISPDTFWTTLADCGDAVLPLVEWKWRLGQNLDWARQFMRPESGHADAFVDEHGRCWTITKRSENEYVAVTEAGDEQVLLPHDLDRLSLSVAAVAVATISAAKLKAGTRQIEGCRIYRLGSYRPFEGCEYPFFMVLNSEPHELLAAIGHLTAMRPGPAVILVPSGESIDEACRLAIDVAQFEWRAIGDFVQPRQDAALALVPAGEKLLDDLLQSCIKAPEPDSGMVFFPTPTGSTWEDVKIRVIDKDTVVLSVRGAERRLTFSQMGMANGTTGLPDGQWHLLMGLAHCQTDAGGTHIASTDDARQRRSRLAKRMRKLLRIESNPFAKRSGVLFPRFAITADPAVSAHR